MEKHRVVSAEEWLVVRKQFLVKEKEFTRLRDELSRERRQLPWTRVDKGYVFDGPDGEKALSDLFDDRAQLIVYHSCFGPIGRSAARAALLGRRLRRHCASSQATR